MESVIARPATEDDLAEVLDLDRATPEAPHWPEQEYRTRLTPDQFALVQRCLFVAEIQGSIVAYAAARTVGNESELESVTVAEPARRKGIAALLCRVVIAWAAAAGATEMDLEVRASSAVAQRLYTKLGFVPIGRRIGYYSAPVEDAVLMRCQISILKPQTVLPKDCSNGSD